MSKAPPAGLVCKKCGSTELRVYDSRRRPGRIWRRRRCKQCGRRVTTSERVVGA